MSTFNRRILQKAVIAVATGGQLSTENAKQFIDTVIEQNKFLQQVETIPMDAASLRIDLISIAARQTIKATESTAPSGTITATMPYRTLTTIETIFPFDISKKFLEQNIEGQAAENKIRTMAAKAYGNDLLDLAINGDETQSGDTFIGINDGWIDIMENDSDVNDCDISGLTSWKDIFKKMLKTMPEKWLEAEGLAFLVKKSDELDYRDELSNRETALGDRYVAEKPVVTFGGYPVIPVPYWQSRKPVLTPIKNLKIGIGRDISIEYENVPRKRVYEYTITSKQDAEYAISEAIVLGSD